MAPVEMYWALKDYEDVNYIPMKAICEINRFTAVQVYNTAFGRAKKDMIKNPKSLVRFGWEEIAQQSLNDMQAALRSLAHMSGVKVEQNGKRIDPKDMR